MEKDLGETGSQKPPIAERMAAVSAAFAELGIVDPNGHLPMLDEWVGQPGFPPDWAKIAVAGLEHLVRVVRTAQAEQAE